MHQGRSARLGSFVAALLCAALPAAAASAEASDPAEPVAAVSQPAADPDAANAGSPPVGPDPDYWLLEEFDWGDDPEVVEESLLFDPYYTCRGTAKHRCKLVTVIVGEEDLLARFEQHEGGLWQVGFLTPDLQTADAREHLHRVWARLADYATRLVGEPTLSLALPELESLELGPPRPTHYWQKEGLAVRLVVGRRDRDLFYVAALFSDPAREEAARPDWEAQLAKHDAKLRKRRAAQAARAAAKRAKQTGSP